MKKIPFDISFFYGGESLKPVSLVARGGIMTDDTMIYFTKYILIFKLITDVYNGTKRNISVSISLITEISKDKII